MKTFLIALVLLATACGNSVVGPNPTPGPQPVPLPPSKETKAIVALFGSYTCSICTKEIPELHDYLKKNMSDIQSSFRVDLYVVGGPGGGSVSQSQATDYAKKLGVDFNPIPDSFCPTHYKQYFQGSCAVPATVVLKQDGTVYRNFGKGVVSFSELQRAVRELVKP